MEIRTPIPAISVLRGGLPGNGHMRAVDDILVARVSATVQVGGLSLYNARRLNIDLQAIVLTSCCRSGLLDAVIFTI